jgi:hypothetical protein
MHKARVEEVGEDHGGTGAFMATSVICREYAGITAKGWTFGGIACGKTERLTEEGRYPKGDTRLTPMLTSGRLRINPPLRSNTTQGSGFTIFWRPSSGSEEANANRICANCHCRVSARVDRA